MLTDPHRKKEGCGYEEDEERVDDEEVSMLNRQGSRGIEQSSNQASTKAEKSSAEEKDQENCRGVEERREVPPDEDDMVVIIQIEGNRYDFGEDKRKGAVDEGARIAIVGIER